jgi:hypothetical protein
METQLLELHKVDRDALMPACGSYAISVEPSKFQRAELVSCHVDKLVIDDW